jgi:dienelactone hydrolase
MPLTAGYLSPHSTMNREPHRLKLFPLFVAFPFLAGCAAYSGQSSAGQSAHFARTPLVVPLWPGGAPGSEGKSQARFVRVTADGEHVVSSIHHPSITVYLPARNDASGAAVIVAPGGGHRELWVDHEGHNVARWLSAHGVAAFVLEYRLARETNSTYTVEGHSLADMQRAIRLVRSRATEWNVDPARLGVMGFSAGGEVAALASMRFDAGQPNAADLIEREGCKPAFQALIYPGRSGNIVPETNSPPVFLACGNNDRSDISEGLANVYLKFKHINVPAELHVFAGVGHGFGLRERNRGAIAGWPQRLLEWMEQLGYLKKS